MLDITQDIQPLTTFRNNSAKFVQRIKRSKRPVVLTVNGKAEMVLLSAAEYQRHLNILARADEAEALRQAEEDVREGRTRPAREVFAEMRKKYGIPR